MAAGADPNAQDGRQDSAFLVTGVFYCGLLLTGVPALRVMKDGLWWIVLALSVTWLNDTAGLVFGKLIGRHKLSPTISPNKTIEGYVAGLVFSAALSAVSSWCGVLQKINRWRSHLGATGQPLFSLGYFDNHHWGNEGDFQWHDLPAATRKYIIEVEQKKC